MQKELTEKEKTAVLMLQNEFNSFDFSPLMRDQVAVQWTQYVPVVGVIFNLIILLIVIFK